MSFLEQHFYIDAGISLPQIEQPIDTEICEVATEFEEQLNLYSGDSSVATVSVENVNIETMSESELKKLETSTTNITDDVKVNLRKRTNKKTTNRKSLLSPPKDLACGSLKNKRYSSVFPSDLRNNRSVKITNRRSLNIGAGDLSRIPVCVKKSHSNADIENEMKSGDGDKASTSSRKPKEVDKTKLKIRPKSEVLTCSDKTNLTTSAITANTASITKTNVPTTSISRRTSGLPVLKK